MISAEIFAGGCGFTTRIQAESGDGQTVSLDIQSECPDIMVLAESLKTADAYEACFGPMKDSPVYILASEHCSHTACPVPSGIIKAMEAACGLALPGEAVIKITKD